MLMVLEAFLQYQDPLNIIDVVSSVYRGLHVLQWTIAKKMTKKIGKSLTLLGNKDEWEKEWLVDFCECTEEDFECDAGF